MVLAAVQQHGCALKFAAASLKGDRKVVLTAVRQHGTALYFVDPKMAIEVAAALLSKQKGELEQWRSGALRFAPDIVDVDESCVSAGTVRARTEPHPRVGSKRPLEQETSGSSGMATVIRVKREKADLEERVSDTEAEHHDQSTSSALFIVPARARLMS